MWTYWTSHHLQYISHTPNPSNPPFSLAKIQSFHSKSLKSPISGVGSSPFFGFDPAIMGKYLRKAKITGEVAVMEHSGLGVRTRARTLELRRLQGGGDTAPDSASYLQLRSRRLEKATPLASSHLRPSGSEEGDEGGAEVSFGENVLEVEKWERDVRETTPCSLIYVSENIATPGSTTRRSNVASRRLQNVASLSIPNTHEMDEFFSGAEEVQQRIFSEKYNYDLVNDCPLPGRYEWIRLDY